MEVITKKQLIRKEVMAVRHAMPKEERLAKSRQIEALLLAHPLFTRAEDILCYVSYGHEVETLPFIEQCLAIGKQVYCPLVFGSEMEFYRILSTQELQEGFHGILEPPEREDMLYIPQELREKSLMVMPGVAFDAAHHRIGYGGGYYDRYLQRTGSLPTAAVAFSCQLVESIPSEKYDVCPQILLTEKGEL